LSLYSSPSRTSSSQPFSSSSDRPPEGEENWSIIWLDNYETISQQPTGTTSGHIFDFDTFQDVLETKTPNYINLDKYEGIYQISYWPLFGTPSRSSHLLNTSLVVAPSLTLMNHLESFESSRGGEEDHGDRPVIGILQCQIRKDSTDRSTFLEPSLSQPLFLTYFNHLMSHIYPHLPSSTSTASSSELSNPPQDDLEHTFSHTLLQQGHDEPHWTLSNAFFSELTSLLQTTPRQSNAGTKEFLTHLTQVIWEHSNHTQLHAVAVFLQEEEREEKESESKEMHLCVGVVRSTSLRTIQLRDDEENQSISIHLNPNRSVLILSSLRVVCCVSLYHDL
jgi:hypothetical protein